MQYVQKEKKNAFLPLRIKVALHIACLLKCSAVSL